MTEPNNVTPVTYVTPVHLHKNYPDLYVDKLIKMSHLQ